MPIYRSEFDWNPSLPSISGELKPGATVSLALGLPGKPPMKVKAIFEDVRPQRKLTWRGSVGAAWLFSGYRVFELQSVSAKTTRFTHVEDVGGILAPVFKLLMGAALQESHDAFNQALKRRAEGAAP